jgi:hypothetical protein
MKARAKFGSVAVALFAILLAPILANAQGTVDSGGTGGAAASSHSAEQGGWGTLRNFKESTPMVTGLPAPGYDAAIEYSNGLTDLEFGRFTQAREDLHHSLSVQPQNARAWFLMGVAYNSAAIAPARSEPIRRR